MTVALFGYYVPFYYDPTYVLVIIGIIITLIAQMNVKHTMSKYAQVYSSYRLTGEEVSRRILSAANINDVHIESVSGQYTDHYDPRTKVVRLSNSVANSTSITAVGVAAHEVGHAIQHNRNFILMTIRSFLVPVANFGSSFGFFMVILGIILSYTGLITFGILLFAGTVAFQVITLPVELDASRRALRLLRTNYILDEQELKMAKKVLTAAALTYVAAAATTILQLLRLILLSRGNRRD